MIDELRKNSKLVKILLILLIIAVGSYVLGLAWQILSQFLDIIIILVIAWLLSFILEPIVRAVQKLSKLSKIISTIITYILVAILIAGISFAYIPLISSQVQTLTKTFPNYLDSAPPIVVSWSASFTKQLNNSVLLIPSAVQFLFSAFIVLIISFYFIVDSKRINQELFNLVPKDLHDILRFTQKVINDIFVSFLRIQLFYGLSSGILTWIILRAFNIEFAASIAFLAGILAIIPLIGPLLAIVPPVLLALLADPLKALIIGIILLIFQQITFNIVGPRLLGKAFKIHPAVILISFLIGLKIAGPLGSVFAIPVLGIGAVMIRRFGSHFLEVAEKATS